MVTEVGDSRGRLTMEVASVREGKGMSKLVILKVNLIPS